MARTGNRHVDSEGRKDIYDMARDFFGFPDEASPIQLVLPSVKRPKEAGRFECYNYPLFEFNVQPDDVLAALRVHSLLTASHGERVNVVFHSDLRSPPDNAFIIGGPATTTFAQRVGNFPIHFLKDEDRPLRTIRGTRGDYTIRFDPPADDTPDEMKSIETDYCLVSKTTTSRGVEVLIGGLRAYGQVGSYDFLSDPAFYEAASAVSSGRDFQILVEVPVVGRRCDGWKIAEMIDSVVPRKVFVSYVRDNKEQVKALKSALGSRCIDVLLDLDSIPSSSKWRAEIERFVEECDFSIICFSQESNVKDSAFMNEEMDLIYSEDRNPKGRPKRENWIIPVRLSDVEIPNRHIGVHAESRQQKMLHEIQWVDLHDDDSWERGIAEIAEVIWSLSSETGRAGSLA